MNAVVPYVAGEDAVRATYRVSPFRTETKRFEVRAGATLQSIVDDAVKDRFMHRLMQVAISKGDGLPEVVPRAMWPHVRPRPGVELHLYAVPQGGNSNKVLGTIIMLAVVVAATVFLGPTGPIFGAGGLELTGLAATAASATAIGLTPMMCGLLLSADPLPPGRPA